MANNYVNAILVCLLFFSCYEKTENKISSLDSQDNYNKLTLNNGDISPLLKIKEMDPVSYTAYWNKTEEDFFIKKKQIKEFNYTLKYLPVEYMISNELKRKKVTQAEVDSLYPEYEGMEYYELKISIDDFFEETSKYKVSDMNEYQNRISYLSFNMQADLKAIVNNNKTIDCKLFHFERTFGLAPYTKVLFAFSKEEIGQSQSRTIVFNDNLFNKGIIKFNWSANDLLEAPKISVL